MLPYLSVLKRGVENSMKTTGKVSIDSCIGCGICLDECEFLASVCKDGEEIAEKFEIESLKKNPVIPYSCNLCDLCEEVCPEDLNIGDMCWEARRQLVDEGVAPLPPHQTIISDQEWVTSDLFALAQPDLRTDTCKRAFFPGCNLPGYSPSLAFKSYKYLQEKLPGTGIILNCCGAPTYFLGDKSGFMKILKGVESEMNRLGAQELIVACPDCYHIIKHNALHLEIRSIYEVIAEEGIPEEAKTSSTKTFSLHDSCKSRWEKNIHDSVREIVREMGYEIEEMEYSRDETRCCGMGGMVPFINFFLAQKVIERRVKEASTDMLSYCASCRGAFAMLGKPSLHILDLVFNPRWDEDKRCSALKPSDIRENQTKFKNLLLEKQS